MNAWKDDPLIVPQSDRWKDKFILTESRQKLELFDTPFTANMGSFGQVTTWEYILGSLDILFRGFSTEIDVPFNIGPREDWLPLWLDSFHQVGNFQRWGHPSTPFIEPKVLRITHLAGWNAPENYPMSPQLYDLVTYKERLDLNTLNYQSIYFPPTELHKLEKCIDYFTDLNLALVNLAKELKIIIAISIQDVDRPHNINGPGQNGHEFWDISRWMYNICPRYNINESPPGEAWYEGNFFNLILNDQLTNPNILGKAGKLYSIHIVSDGLGMYHGTKHNENPIVQTPQQDYFSQDIEYYNSMKPHYNKIGGCIVNSPKNAEFFPMWMPQNVVDNTNNFRAFCLKDAQVHFHQAVDALGENWSLLMRDIKFVAPPDSGKHAELDDVRGHMDFVGPQIPIASIVEKAREFFTD